MFRCIAACLAVGFAVTGTNDARSGEMHSDDWINLRCASYRGAYCRIPFSVALAEAQALSGPAVKIQIRGYIVREPEGFALYADLSAAQLGWRSDAFLIRVPQEAKIRASLEKLNNKLVSVRGRVVLEASDHDEYWAVLTLDEPAVSAGIRGEKLDQPSKSTREGLEIGTGTEHARDRGRADGRKDGE